MVQDVDLREDDSQGLIATFTVMVRPAVGPTVLVDVVR
jgi:hypothetical protein